MYAIKRSRQESSVQEHVWLVPESSHFMADDHAGRRERLLTAVLAVLAFPARRAARINPVSAMRV